MYTDSVWFYIWFYICILTQCGFTYVYWLTVVLHMVLHMHIDSVWFYICILTQCGSTYDFTYVYWLSVVLHMYTYSVWFYTWSYICMLTVWFYICILTQCGFTYYTDSVWFYICILTQCGFTYVYWLSMVLHMYTDSVWFYICILTQYGFTYVYWLSVVLHMYTDSVWFYIRILTQWTHDFPQSWKKPASQICICRSCVAVCRSPWPLLCAFGGNRGPCWPVFMNIDSTFASCVSKQRAVIALDWRHMRPPTSESSGPLN